MSIEDFYNKDVFTYTATQGPAPAREKTWVLNESLRGAVHSLSGNEAIIDPIKDIRADVRVFVNSTTAVVGERLKIDNKIYEIVFPDDPMFRGHHVELKCKYLPGQKLSDYP